MRITKVLCALLFFSSAVSAQTSEARTEYLNWKKQVSVTLQDPNHLYTFQVAVAVQRTDKTHIHILVAAVGRTPNYTFKLQPINAIQFFDVDQDVKTTGKSDDWGAGQDTRVPRLGYLLDFDKVIECEEETNAVFVSIKPVPNKGQPRETTTLKMIVLLEDKWHFDKKDFFVPREQIDKSSPSESLNSYFLPDSTAKLVTLSGKVLRSDRNEVIENAYILLMQEKEPGLQAEHFDTRSDSEGKYQFTNLPGGKYTVSVHSWFRNRADVPCGDVSPKVREDGTVTVEWQGKSNAFMEIVTIKSFPVKAGRETSKDFDIACR